jgi:transposase
MLRVTLSPAEEKAVTRLRNQTGDPRSERALIILLSHQGNGPIEIGQQLKRNPHTIRLWIKRYLKDGLSGLERLYSPGRPKQQKAQLLALIPDWFSNGPAFYGYSTSLWTVALLCDQYLKTTGREVSPDTVERSLMEAGYSYRRARKSVPERAPSKEEKKQQVLELIDEIKGMMEKEETVVLALDETHLSSEPYVIRGWYKKNSVLAAHPCQTGELHGFWRVESRGTTIYLEKRGSGQQQHLDRISASTSQPIPRKTNRSSLG